MEAFGWLKRFRTGRGFGVHSPFAYYFITRVLRERLPYYSFRTEVTAPDERLLFRVANYFRPSTVALLGADASRAGEVISKACPGARTVGSGADFTYVSTGASLPSDFKVAYCAGVPPVVPDNAMTFTDGRTFIAVRRPSLPAQHFTIRF